MHYTHVANAMHDLNHGFGSARTEAKRNLLKLAGQIDELAANSQSKGRLGASSQSCVDSVGCLIRGEGRFTEEVLGRLREALETLVASIGLQETAKRMAEWLRINGERGDYGWTVSKKLRANQALDASAEFNGDHWSMLIVDVSLQVAQKSIVRPRIVVHAEYGLVTNIFLFNDQNLNRPIQTPAELDYVSETLNTMFEGHLLESV